MANGTPTGVKLYKFLMDAKNSKLIFLSGTPIINNLFEMSKLYNILQGPTPTITYKLVSQFTKNINYNSIKQKKEARPTGQDLLMLIPEKNHFL